MKHYTAYFWYDTINTIKATTRVEANSLEEAKTIFESWCDDDVLFDNIVEWEDDGHTVNYDIDPVHDVEWADED